MPVHDAVAIELFDKAVRSILAQSLDDFELVILLDGVRSEMLIKAATNWERAEARIRLLYSSSQNGIANSLNTLINHATGEFIARMDADDISLKDRLKSQV